MTSLQLAPKDSSILETKSISTLVMRDPFLFGLGSISYSKGTGSNKINIARFAKAASNKCP